MKEGKAFLVREATADQRKLNKGGEWALRCWLWGGSVTGDQSRGVVACVLGPDGGVKCL